MKPTTSRTAYLLRAKKSSTVSGLIRSKARSRQNSSLTLPFTQSIEHRNRRDKSPSNIVYFATGQSLHEVSDSDLKNAFYVLLTDRLTHPATVVELMRSYANIDSNRLIILPVESLDAKSIKDVVRRVKRAFSPKAPSEFILDAYIDGSSLCVRGPCAKLIKVPVKQVRALRELTQTELKHFEIDPDGAYINWPRKDIHLGWEQLLAVIDEDLSERIAKENSDFNRRYGEAIRRCRQRAKISTDRVKGLSPNELKRIETGMVRASSTVLKSLAQAHQLTFSQYLDLLSKETSKP